MAGFASTKPNAPITGINVTPLVDITLVLLIIFMVTAKLVVFRAMPMDLAHASTGATVEAGLTVTLAADGRAVVDGSSLADDQLVDRARRALAAGRAQPVVVQADGGVPHRRVMHVLDLLRRTGITRIAFAVQPGAGDRPQ
jgi:biopolymer transport protein ExbD